MTVTVCIPMYNESANVMSCRDRLRETLEEYSKRSGMSYEIIFFDDGSSDGCASMISDENTPNGCIRVLGESVNHGKGYAVRQSVKAAAGDYIMYTDCDLAYGTDIIPEAFDVLISGGYDVVAGSRKKHRNGYNGYSFMRKAASKTYMGLLRRFTGVKVSDSQCGFKLFTAECGKPVFEKVESDRWEFDLEFLLLAQKAGASFGEFPVMILNHGESKISLAKDSISMAKKIKAIKKRVKTAEMAPLEHKAK